MKQYSYKNRRDVKGLEWWEGETKGFINSYTWDEYKRIENKLESLISSLRISYL